MAIEVKSRKILLEAERLSGLGLARKEVIRVLRKKFRIGPLDAYDYWRLANVRLVKVGLSWSESTDLAGTASIQYVGWLRRAVKWVGSKVRSLVTPHRHPDSLPRS